MTGWLARRGDGAGGDRLLSGLALVAILGVGAYLRLRDLDLDWFIVDQARDIRTALGIVHASSFPLLGPEVQSGQSHTWGPLYFYLLAIPLVFAPSLARAAAFLGLLNLAAVYLTYRFGTRFFGRGVGLVSAALFATYPLAVISGRGLWNVAPLPLFTVVFFYCLAAVVVERRSVMIVPAVAALACMVQLHLSAVAALVVLVLVLAIYRPPMRWPHLVLGAGVWVVLLSPYALGQWLDGFRDVRATLAFSRAFVGPGSEIAPWPSMRPAFFASADLSLWLERTFGGTAWGRLGALVQRAESWVLLTGAVYLALRVAAAWAARIAPALRTGLAASTLRGYGLLTLWIWTPLVLLLFKKSLRSWYYLDVVYPAQFLAGAILLAALLRAAAPRLRIGSTRGVQAVACAGVLLVAVADVDSLRRLWRVTQSSGAMPLPSAVIAGGSIESSAPIGLMPIRYKEGIVRALAHRTPGGAAGFYRRVHGSVFDVVAEDGGFFLETLAGPRGSRPESDARAVSHFAVLGPGLAERFAPSSPGERVGPFAIIEYVPLIDYSSWTYSQGRGATSATHPLGRDGWTPVPVPTRRVPDAAAYGYAPPFVWPGVPVLVRGEIDVVRAPPHLRLVVALRQHEGHHQVDACRVNGALAPVDGVFVHATAGARLSETVFDLSRGLREGRNTVTCDISGSGHRFDLDVYELRG